MARIPDDTIERIKQEISLLRLVESQGHQVTKMGKDQAIACPFHDDDTPSLIISPKSNLYHCFGCGAAGSVIDWVMKTKSLGFREAAVWLSNECLPFAGESTTENDRPSLVAAPVLAADLGKENDQAVLHRVIDFYHDALAQNPEALEYLESRGLNTPELIHHFKLGYANRTLGLTLPDKRRKAGSDIRGQLERVGIYRESGHEHFNGSLVVPVINAENDITEIYGRKILNNLRKGTPKHLYLPGPHEGVFNESSLNHEEVILCESLIDALTFWRWGFKNVTTSYGTAGFTDELLAAFKEHAIKRVLIAYDRDEAGNLAAEKLAKRLNKENIDCYRVLFPKGMDANEYTVKMRPARKSLELVIRKAEWMGAGEAPERVASHPPRPLVADSPVAESVALPASPMPANTAIDVPVEEKENELVLALENRRYRVRGLSKSTSYEQLKINLCVTSDAALHVDQLDLYNAKHRHSFMKQAAVELGVTDETIKKDLAKLLLTLEKRQDEHIQKTTTPKAGHVELNNEEHQAALELLKDKDLLKRILEDFNCAGVVGEETNKLVGYLAAVSRKLDNPLAVIIQSSSAAGKSSLMTAVLSMMPEEERIQYSAMTGQSLFYMGETNLKHKILAIAEEEGAEQASYALKLLQSEGELTIASTGKDADGNLTTQEYRVEGPVMLFSTTTAIDIDEELMNRCIVLTVNESREQTQLIHERQRERETLEGLLADEDRKNIIALHRNAQRLLRPLRVVNPFAKQLTFMDKQTRSRRDHMKYLRLIKTVALLHQYQRDIKTVNHKGKTLEYIEVALHDIAVANQLVSDVLGRTLNELPPQTQILLDSVYQMVTRECLKEKISQGDYRFSRKQVRDEKGWSDFQIKKHMQRLEALEYVLIHSGGRGKSIVYELLYHGEGVGGNTFLMGLIDPKLLGYDEEKEPLKSEKEGASSPQSAPKLPSSSPCEKHENATHIGSSDQEPEINGKTHNTIKHKRASYRTSTHPFTAPAHPEPAALEHPCSSAASSTQY